MAVLLCYCFRVRKRSGASIKRVLSKLVGYAKACAFGVRTVLVGHGKDVPEPGQKEEVWQNRKRIY
jgi:hypothetical protein